MPDDEIDAPNASRLGRKALSRWENEGGAESGGQQAASASSEKLKDVPDLKNAELVQLRIRVIALENLMITFLASASHEQLDLVREMAAYILPRPGSTQHPLTIDAAGQMLDLVERAARFRA